MARQRRSKKELIISKIEELDNLISATEEKLEKLKADKMDYAAQLKELNKAEEKVRKEVEAKEITDFIKKNKISLDDVKEFLASKN